MSVAERLLEIRDLVVAFDAFHAIDGLDLTLRRARGALRHRPQRRRQDDADRLDHGPRAPDERLDQVRRRGAGRPHEHEIVRAGIGRTFQTPSVFDELTVLENVDLAAWFRLPFRSLLRRRKGVPTRSPRCSSRSTSPRSTDDPAGSLSHGQKQWLEIAMVLVQHPQLLLLDEPVAGMTADERLHTGELDHGDRRAGHDGARHRARHGLRAPLRAQGDGDAQGQDPDGGTVAEVQKNETVREVYLGRPRDARGAAEVLGMTPSIEPLRATDRPRTSKPPPILTRQGPRGRLRPDAVIFGVSLEVPEGGLCCLMGRNGVGKTTLLQTIVGLQPAARHRSRSAARRSPRRAPYNRTKAGIAYVPQGREAFPVPDGVREPARRRRGVGEVRRRRDRGGAGALPAAAQDARAPGRLPQRRRGAAAGDRPGAGDAADGSCCSTSRRRASSHRSSSRSRT